MLINEIDDIAPALEAVDYEWMKWPNQFSQPSEFRGYPTPELEQAWENISRATSYFPFSTDRLLDIQKSNVSAGTWLPAGESSDAVVAMLEVNHQLHCLVSLV